MNNSIQAIVNWNKENFSPLQLLREQQQHLNLEGKSEALTSVHKSGGFSQLVLQALQKSSDLQQNSSLLQQQAIISPDSVNAHTLAVEMSKAELSLRLGKTVIERALQAYREITNLR